jgi:uncharacterized protein (DUF2267 family)
MERRLSWTELVESVTNGGVQERETAERALRATLGALGERFTTDESRALAARLPDEVRGVLDEASPDGDFDAPELYRRVWRRDERMSLGAAREHADIVLRALGALLDDGLRMRLVRALPEPMRDLWVAPVRGEPPPHPQPPSRRARGVETLAQGHPGSRHPLSESAAPSGHAHSVARNDDPHAETKLSTSHGLTQEGLGETLATGHPPAPARPISEANDDFVTRRRER